jgi:hypothetical protein
MLVWGSEGVNVPAACIICSKDSPTMMNQSKCRCSRLLIVKGINKATCRDTDAQVD